MVGDGRYIGQTKGKERFVYLKLRTNFVKGIMYSETPSDCPTGLSDWQYLDTDLGWRDNGRITLECSA